MNIDPTQLTVLKRYHTDCDALNARILERLDAQPAPPSMNSLARIRLALWEQDEGTRVCELFGF